MANPLCHGWRVSWSQVLDKPGLLEQNRVVSRCAHLVAVIPLIAIAACRSMMMACVVTIAAEATVIVTIMEKVMLLDHGDFH